MKNSRGLSLFGLMLFCVQANAVESLSYSGRLVQINGAPVAGPVSIRADLAYSGSTGTVLCSDEVSGVTLSKGIFHVKLVFACTGGKTLNEVLLQAPAGETVAIQITDTTPGHNKAYGFQALHSLPYANVASIAAQLEQNGAGDGEFLKWDNSTKKWKPGTVSGASGGTVTSVSASGPLSVATPTSTPAISIAQANGTTSGYLSSADWNTFNNKEGTLAGGTTAQYYRGDKSWQTLDTSVVPENVNLYFTNARALGVPLTGFVTAAGAIVATDSTLDAFGKAQGQINAINSAAANYLIKNSTDTVTGVVNVGTTGLLQLTYVPVGMNDATNKSYVDSEVGTKVSKAGDTVTGVLTLNNDLKVKGGTNYVTVKGHATSANYNLTLPQTAGTAGYVLSTDGSGNTTWSSPAVGSATITDGSIVDADVNASAGIAQSKIANLTNDLAAKVSTTLNSGNIFVGNGSNVATGVTVSGDATLSNSGVLTLANTAITAGTYSSVTVDGKGRVTGGTNPSVVNSLSVTAPITNSGTTSAPIIAIPAATTSINGHLTSTDWNTFNNKQAAINSASTVTTGSITTSLQNGVNINPFGVAAGNTGEIRFYELAAGGTNYTSLKAPDALGANINYTLPSTAPTAGQVLSSTAAGVMSWTTIPTAPVTTVFGRSGAVTATAGDYTAAQVSYSPAGNIAATTVQAALDEIDSEKQGLITAGTTAQYFRGDKTFVDFGTDVRGTALTGYAVGANTALVATDSTLAAFQKIQGQINATNTAVAGKEPAITAGTTAQYIRGDKTLSTFATDAINSVLSTFALNGTSKPTVSTSDSVVGAFGKVQKFINDINSDYVSKTANQTINGSLAINSVTGFITVPTPVNPTDAANKSYVDGFGQWTKTGSDIYFNSGKVGVGTNAPQSTFEVSGGVGDGVLTISADTDNSGENDNARISLIQDGTGATSTGMEIGFSGEDTANSGNMFSLAKRYGGVVDWNTFNINTQTGFIGIGTASPVSKLEVKDGYVQVSRSETTTQPNFFNAFNSESNSLALRYTEEAIGSIPADVWQFRLGNNAKDIAFSAYDTAPTIMMKAGGNVGIGTAAPSEKLEVVGKMKLTNGFSASSAAITYTSDTGYLFLGAQSGVSTNGAAISLAGPTNADGTGAGPGGITFVTPGISPAMVIKSDGKTGIGTASPGFKLDVNGLTSIGGQSGNLDPVGAPNLTSMQNSGKMLVGWNRNAGSGEVDLIANRAGGTRGGFNFYDYTNAGALNHLMNIDGGGNVGIGTLYASQKLEVVGSILTTGSGYIGTNVFNGSFGVSTGRSFMSPTGYIWSTMDSGGGSSNLYLHRHDTSQYYVQFGYGAANVGTISTNGSSVSYNTTSDYRLKENVKPMDDALKRMLLIQPKRFNYITTPNQRVDGFIAHELAVAVPEAVTGKKDAVDKEGKIIPQLVDYSKVIPLIAGAVKELYKKFLGQDEQLANHARAIASKADKTEIETLKVQNKKLQQENDAIKAYLCKKDPKAPICK